MNSELTEELRGYYSKEAKRDSDIAFAYRNRINPIDGLLPEKDTEEITRKIVQNVKAELSKRKDKGYTIDLSLIEEEVDKFLKECKVN